MIKVSFFTNEYGNLTGFTIKDHAGGEYGTDIVCAAVSSVAYMVANTLLEIERVDADVTIDDKNALFTLKINPKDLSRSENLLAGMKLHFLQLEDQYPKQIRVNYLEVLDNA